MTLLKSTPTPTSAIERLIFNTSIQEKEFTILEGICGVGKSTSMIKHIKDNPDERYLVVLPLLDEIERYQESLPELNFKAPSDDRKHGTKTEQFKDFLKDKSNILCTHSLFSLWDTDIEYLIADAGYHIIIDEEVGVVEPVGINAQVIENLKKLKYISIDSSSGLVTWNYEESGYAYNGEKEHQTVITKAKSGSLYCYDDKFFVYELPHRLFVIGAKYTIMTYLFKGNLLDAYLNSHNIKCHIKQIDPEGARKKKEQARGLIEFVPLTTNMKKIRDKNKRSKCKPFSKEFIRKRMTCKERQSFCEAVRNKVYKREKYDLEKVMITCFKCFMETDDGKKPKINMMPRSMDSCLVPMNARGSNQWGNRDFVIHMVDHYPEPHLNKYLSRRSNGCFDPDVFALSMLVQYVYRSAIRNGEPIKLMICSERMERLFRAWLAETK